MIRQIKSSVTLAVSIVFNLRLDFRFKPLDLQQSYRLLIMREVKSTIHLNQAVRSTLTCLMVRKTVSRLKRRDMFPATLSPLFVGTLLLIAPQPIDVQVINAADDTVNAAPNDDTPTASDAESQLSGTLSQAESKLEQAMSLRERSLEAMDRGEEDLAFDLVRQAKRLAPRDPQVVFLMALLLADRHRYPEAIRMLDELAKTNAEIRLPAMGQTADWLIKSGDWDEGESRYLSLLKEAPNASLVHRGLAELYLRQGRGVEATAFLRNLCRLGDVQEYELRHLLIARYPFPGDATPENFDPIGRLGLAKAQAAYADWGSVANSLILDDQSTPEEVGFKGRCAVEQENWGDLAKWFSDFNERDLDARDTTQIKSIVSDSCYALGVYCEREEKYLKAADYLSRVVLKDPTDVPAYQGLMRVTEKLGLSGIAAQLKQRVKRIERTQQLGQKMASSQDRSYEEMSELIQLLVDLQRPLEALAWRGVRLAYGRQHGTVTPQQAQELLQSIIRERELLLQKVDEDAYSDFVVCGLSKVLLERGSE